MLSIVPEDCSLCCKLEDGVGRFRATPSSRGGQRGRDAHRIPNKEDEMSEDEQRRGTEEQSDEVEAHRRSAAATDEGAPEGEDGEVEAHRRSAGANDEGATEGEDEVEAHAVRANRPGKTA
jgi:hypothetical protein